MKRTGIVLSVLALSLIGASAIGVWQAEREGSDSAASPSPPADQLARGAYLAKAGNCAGCHTARGGATYAGGRELPTPFGTFVTPNITPDRDKGIGQWTAQDFWRAMHHGKGRDGRPLYPAFPYTEYTKVTREDSDAIFAYLQTVAPANQGVATNRLDFPYNLRPLLYVWRALYFRPGVYQPTKAQSDEWNRGAYLVQGLGHCNACHATRNALGAVGGAALGGGQVAGRSWYAPSLTSMAEAGSGERNVDETARLLSTGIAGNSAAAGPMAEVIAQSLQHLSATDVRAMAVYLQSISVAAKSTPASTDLSSEAKLRINKGAAIYERHCEDCHGASGEGAPGIYPALAGNRGVTTASPLNTIRSVMDGGFTPVTATNPRPYGMPPFGHALSNEEVAQVVSFIRNSWGNRASVVTAVQVDRSGSD
ncbi:MAG: cytochrome c [Betaproteobacteria bacterium]|nr:cytochrome c [Betaproteobacteria bacterium]